MASVDLCSFLSSSTATRTTTKRVTAVDFGGYYHTLIRLHSINLDLSDSCNATPSIFVTVNKLQKKSPEIKPTEIVGDKINILGLIFITRNDSENIVDTAVSKTSCETNS